MNIFDYAMQMEKDGEDYYRQIARGSNDPGIKSIFNMLADDEVKHYYIIKKMKQDQKAEMANTSILNNSKNIFAKMKENGYSVPSEEDQIAMYQQAGKNEKLSEDFYREKAAEMSDSGQKAIFVQLADEERRHFFLVENIIEFVKRPDTWLENAEFNHLDTY